MPRLLLFAACEKFIIDQQNNASMISLLQELAIPVQDNTVPPSGAAAAMKWDAVAIWLKGEDDFGKTYEQRIALFEPSGEPTGVSVSSTFAIEPATHRNVTTIYGFPI